MKFFKGGLLSWLALAFTISATAQHVMGPYNLYVSKQSNAPVTMQGSLPASADEGRSIQIGVSDIVGPIQVNPQNFNLNGPPCPTWDAQGHRVPANPPPNNTTTFSGQVSVNQAQIPAAGTSADAQFKVKENGFWTKCRKHGDEQVFYDSTVIVKFKVWSVKITLADRNVQVCKQEQKTINVASTFPANEGTVTWAALNGKIRIVSSDQTKCVIEGQINGTDKLVATYTKGPAVYKDTSTIKVNNVKFKKAQYEYPWYPNGTLDMVTLLNDSSEKVNLDWTVTTTSTSRATINANTGVLTYPAAAGGTYTVTAKIRGAVNCLAVVKVVLAGFRVVLDIVRTPCDGEEANLHLEPVPNTLPRAFLAQFGPITLESNTKFAFRGNPANKNRLDFAALDAQYRSKVLNCYWYSMRADECTGAPGAVHQIQGKATVQGQQVNSTNKAELTVSLAYGMNACIFGSANVIQTFTGFPTIATNWNGMRWISVVNGVGTLTRAPRGQATTRVPAASQFRTMLVDEEDYHVGQIEGRNGVLCADLWSVQRVLAMLAGRFWFAPTAPLAQALAVQAAAAAINIETQRCNNLFAYPPIAGGRRCALEREAKNATGIQHAFTMRCGYPRCP